MKSIVFSCWAYLCLLLMCCSCCYLLPFVTHFPVNQASVLGRPYTSNIGDHYSFLSAGHKQHAIQPSKYCRYLCLSVQYWAGTSHPFSTLFSASGPSKISIMSSFLGPSCQQSACYKKKTVVEICLVLEDISVVCSLLNSFSFYLLSSGIMLYIYATHTCQHLIFYSTFQYFPFSSVSVSLPLQRCPWGGCHLVHDLPDKT